MSRLASALGVLAVALAACATSGQVAERSAAVRARLAGVEGRARACAPEALARARAEAAMAERLSETGDAIRAALHLGRAESWAASATAAEALAACAAPKGPPARIFEPAPGRGDGDGDGVPDATDACLTEREDVDGWLDGDGCPDPDNDGDGIGDQVDQCPSEAEDRDGYEDIDGCPEVGGGR